MAYVGHAGSDRFTGTNDEPFCCRCHEDFPVAHEPARWTMGELRPLAKAHRRIQRVVMSHDDCLDDLYLCGNCWFDLID